MALLLVLLAAAAGTVSCAEEAESGPRSWIDFPRDGSAVEAGAPVPVVSHAYAGGGVAEVLLSINGVAYRSDAPPDAGSPFVEVTQEWSPTGEGVYTLQVMAYDTAGEAGEADVVTVNVVAALATPTGVPTDTPPPTGTAAPAATSTPPPSATPIPGVEVSFWAENESITAGECTILHWDVEHATAVFVDGAGVTGHGTRRVCPGATTTYELRVEAPAGDVERRVRIDVSEPPDTTVPPVPSPGVPEDGLELSCRSEQTLAWLPVSDPSGIAGYTVRLERQVTAGEWTSVREWGPVSGKQAEADVQCGGIYRWAVRARDGAGNESDWSAWSHFSVSLN